MRRPYSTCFAAICACACVAAATAQECGLRIKSITFEGPTRIDDVVPYTEALAYQDFAPHGFLTGFYGDQSTRGTTNKRAQLVTDDGKKHLQVLLPQGCVTSECAMQVKHHFIAPVESATLKYKLRFGPNFDWVRGGKLPGFCGAGCITGCKDVTGLNGWSSRQMWRPCVWPPESPLNTIDCRGGKMVAYVYHMFKEHWCGDDFEYADEMWAREYKTSRDPVVPKSFFQPNQDEWYTIWSHVAMNTAGPPDEPPNWKRDGKLQTWLQGPDFGPILVVDKQDMGWRQFTNVSIDTLYFSVFFGGSSASFQARKDEVIDFDDFEIWEGRCDPADEPFPQVDRIFKPEWDGMVTDLNRPTVLSATVKFERAFTGGGCGNVHVLNTASVPCDEFEVEINIRPGWGWLLTQGMRTGLSGLTLIDQDRDLGWMKAVPEGGRGSIDPGRINSRGAICIRNAAGAKYLPATIAAHVVAHAICTKGPAASITASGINANSPNNIEPPAGQTTPAETLPPSNPVEAPVDMPAEAPTSLVVPDPSWCLTTSGEGGIWNTFLMVKAKLCSNTDGFEKPWGPIDEDVVICPCGQVPVFPDDICADDPDTPPCTLPSPGTPPEVACATPLMDMPWTHTLDKQDLCIRYQVTYKGSGLCQEFAATTTLDPAFFDMSKPIDVGRADLDALETETGKLLLSSRAGYQDHASGSSALMPICAKLLSTIDSSTVQTPAVKRAIQQSFAECTLCE